MVLDTKPFFILASASPRRKQLLTEAGYDFKVVVSRVDESEFGSINIKPVDYAKRLALAKAVSVASKHKDILIVGADTIVDLDGEIIGKPVNAEDAERITKKLFSTPHKVITAIAIVRSSDKLQIVESDTTVVYPKLLTEKQISEHIKSGTWEDKAGAYAIQETGDEFVEKIEGSLTNVMGMPMELFKRLIREIT